MKWGKFFIQFLSLCGTLLVFIFAGAIKLPALTATGSLIDYPLELFFVVVSVLVLYFIASFLGKGIRGVKAPLEATMLTYVSALMIGGILALLTLFNFPYSPHLNLTWLGTEWYDPWITVFLVGAPMLLAFIVV